MIAGNAILLPGHVNRQKGMTNQVYNNRSHAIFDLTCLRILYSRNIAAYNFVSRRKQDSLWLSVSGRVPLKSSFQSKVSRLSLNEFFLDKRKTKIFFEFSLLFRVPCIFSSRRAIAQHRADRKTMAINNVQVSPGLSNYVLYCRHDWRMHIVIRPARASGKLRLFDTLIVSARRCHVYFLI